MTALPQKLYFRIGEVAGLVGVEPHVLRYWEREFRSIRPTKSAKGQRVYSRKDVEALMVVKDLLYAQGFTIAGAKKRLQRPADVQPAVALSASPIAEVAGEPGADELGEGPGAFTADSPAALSPTHRPAYEAAQQASHHASQAAPRAATPRSVSAADSAGTARAAAGESARRALVSLRAEVEALLHELGG